MTDWTKPRGFALVATLLWMVTPGSTPAQEVPGLGPAGNLAAVQFEPAIPVTLSGADARQQLLVTGRYSSGQLHDLTQQVSYAVSPPGIVGIDSNGFVTPLADGQATVTARVASGQTETLDVNVEGFDATTPVNFPNQIVPILDRGLLCFE